MTTVSLAALRRLAVSVQGYTTRFRRGSADDIAATIAHLSCVQLDSISAVDRSHRLALGARVGAYPRGTISRLLGAGRIFEYWAHEACLIPIEDYPLCKRPMQEGRRAEWYAGYLEEGPELVESVLGEIRERGPLPSRHFEGTGGGGMWNWKPAKRVLEGLWNLGELAIAGRQGFQRLYDLSERVIPREYLDAPVPSEEELLRALALRAVRARGVLSEPAIREHYRLRGGAARLGPHLDSLVSDSLLERLAVDDGGAPVYVVAGTDLDLPAPAGGLLLSPFDNLVWDRAFHARIFGFRHTIEVYKREHERVYGYYVLPFLLGDRMVGRADLKADRREGVLRVRAFHLEPGVRDRRRVEGELERALARLARTIGLERVER